jgi:hypothetical protein
VVDEGVTGFVVRDVEGMARRIRTLDGFDRRACLRQARARFSASRMVDEHLRLYRRLVPLQAPADEGNERPRAAAPGA